MLHYLTFLSYVQLIIFILQSLTATLFDFFPVFFFHQNHMFNQHSQ